MPLGMPSVAPVALFKMVLIQHLYGCGGLRKKSTYLFPNLLPPAGQIRWIFYVVPKGDLSAGISEAHNPAVGEGMAHDHGRIICELDIQIREKMDSALYFFQIGFFPHQENPRAMCLLY